MTARPPEDEPQVTIEGRVLKPKEPAPVKLACDDYHCPNPHCPVDGYAQPVDKICRVCGKAHDPSGRRTRGVTPWDKK